ncbi:MAG: hypothetical protein AB7P03_10065 [Kofleriaceae bacterium]
MAETSRLKRRPAIMSAGWVVFLCVFLPTLRVCDEPRLPVEFPPLYAAYLGPGLIAVIYAALGPRFRRVASAVLIAMLWSTAGLFTLLFIVDARLHGLAIVLALGFVVAGVMVIPRIARGRMSRRGVAIISLSYAVLVAGWNTLLAIDADAMWGAWVALGASSILVVAVLEELVDARRELVELRNAALPTARAFPPVSRVVRDRSPS